MLADTTNQNQTLKIRSKNGCSFLVNNIALDPASEVCYRMFQKAFLYLKCKGKEILIASLDRSSCRSLCLNLTLEFSKGKELELLSKSGCVHIIGSYRSNVAQSPRDNSTTEMEDESEQSSKQEKQRQQKIQIPEQPQILRRSTRQRAPPPPSNDKPSLKKAKAQKDVLKNMAKLFELNEDDLDDDEEDKSLDEKAGDSEDSDSDATPKQAAGSSDSDSMEEQNKGRKIRKPNDQSLKQKIDLTKREQFSKPTKNPYD